MNETGSGSHEGGGEDVSGVIPGLEQRINSALARIGAALDGAGSGNDKQIADLSDALAEERANNSGLEERLREFKERQENSMQELEERVQSLGRRAAETERELTQLRQTAGRLRENNQQLREANAAGLGDADLINTGLQTELDALRADQDASKSEIETILSELRNAIFAADVVPAAAATEENV